MNLSQLKKVHPNANLRTNLEIKTIGEVDFIICTANIVIPTEVEFLSADAKSTYNKSYTAQSIAHLEGVNYEELEELTLNKVLAYAE